MDFLGGFGDDEGGVWEVVVPVGEGMGVFDLVGPAGFGGEFEAGGAGGGEVEGGEFDFGYAGGDGPDLAVGDEHPVVAVVGGIYIGDLPFVGEGT